MPSRVLKELLEKAGNRLEELNEYRLADQLFAASKIPLGQMITKTPEELRETIAKNGCSFEE